MVSGTEWLEFSDLIEQAVLQRQSYILQGYSPFLSVAFHLFYASQSHSKLSYPSSQYEVHKTDVQIHSNVITICVETELAKCKTTLIVPASKTKTRKRRPEDQRPTKTKTPYKNEDLRKRRPPTKTKTYENEDPFIFCRKRNNFVRNKVMSV